MDRGIKLWDKVLLCCSKDSRALVGDKEITTAFDKEQSLWKERGRNILTLIPLNLDGYMPGGELLMATQ